jgi:hypothetical protein
MSLFEELIPGEPLSEEEARQWLAAREIPEFVDEVIGLMIKKKEAGSETLFLEVVKEVLQRHLNAAGKGVKAIEAARTLRHNGNDGAVLKGMKNLKAPGKGWGDQTAPLKYGYYDTEPGVPKYCTRDPDIRPTDYQIKRSGVTTWRTTRSKQLQPQHQKDYASTVAGQFNYGAQKCIKQCKAIQAECRRNGTPFYDQDFWFGSRDTMYPKGVPSDCTVTEPKKTMRAKDLYPGATVFANGATSNDIVQGAVGDCFFIGAVSALASCTAQKLNPTQRLFVFSDVENGIYGVMWAKNGGWEWVIVDDWVAVSQDGRGNVWPQYACPGTAPELWPLIIEKAYAKIHYCWDSIDGGWSREALEDLTGGMGYTLDLKSQHRYTHGGRDFNNFKELCDDSLTILGCAVGYHVTSVGGAGRAGEQGAMEGLFKGHAYSVIKFAVTSDGKGFVRVRNPWGNEAEWTGAYSDNDKEWRYNPHHKRELKPEFKDDGAFWMTWDDFRYIFTDIDVVRFFPYEQVALCMFGISQRNDLKAENTYILKVGGNVSNVVISLGQDDQRTHKSHTKRKNARFYRMRLSAYELDRLPDTYSDLQNCLGKKMQSPYEAKRCVFTELTNVKPGYFSLVPKIMGSGVGLHLRVFAPEGTDLQFWRFSDGPQSAMKTDDGKAAGSGIRPVAVPTAVGGQIVADDDDDTNGQISSEQQKKHKIYEALGLDSAEEFEEKVTEVFKDFDYYQYGRLDKRKTLRAFQQLLLHSDKAKEAFDQAWNKANTRDSRYFRVKASEFKDLLEEFVSVLVA